MIWIFRVLCILSILGLQACSTVSRTETTDAETSEQTTPSEEAYDGDDPFEADRLALVLNQKLAGVNLPDCKISRKQIVQVMPKLLARHHEAVEKLAKEYENASNIGAEWIYCKRDCSCAFYFDVLDLQASEAVDQAAYARIKRDMRLTSARDRATCAWHFQYVCSGELFKKLSE